MRALHPISIAKYWTLKPNLWRSIQRWAYLWYLYSWLLFTLCSKRTVSSSIEIHFLILSITTRSGLSLVTRRFGGIVHGFSLRCILIIRLLSLTLTLIEALWDNPDHLLGNLCYPIKFNKFVAESLWIVIMNREAGSRYLLYMLSLYSFLISKLFIVVRRMWKWS